MIHQLSLNEIDASLANEARKYLCNKCNLMVYNTYVTPCNHIFCLKCIDLSNFICPVDDTNLNHSQLIKAKFIDEHLNQFKCKCNQQNKGCLWKGNINEYYTKHCYTCKFIQFLNVIDITDSPIKDEFSIKPFERLEGKEYVMRTSSECSLLNPFIYYFEDYALSSFSDLKWSIKFKKSNPKKTIAFLGVYDNQSDQYYGIKSNSKDKNEVAFFQSNSLINIFFDKRNKNLLIISNKKELFIEEIDPINGLYYPCIKLQTANSAFSLFIE